MTSEGVFARGRCPSWNTGMRCRLEFGHDGNHEAHKEDISWTRQESEPPPVSLDFGVNILADPDPVTKDYSQ